jgi:predicted amidophosphoribosyltransferase
MAWGTRAQWAAAQRRKREKWRAAGLCRQCGRPKKPEYGDCFRCRVRHSAYARKRYWARRVDEAA